MKFGQILVCSMTNISDMFLTEYWRLETSSGLDWNLGIFGYWVIGAGC